MRKKVLVFPCGSEIGLEIYKSLNRSTHFELVGGSSVDDHGKYVYSNYVGDLPNVSDDNFIEKLNQVVTEQDIAYIFPAHDSVVLKLAQEQDNIKVRVITSPTKTCEVARSKKSTYETFKDVVATPKVYASVGDIPADGYPVFLKPDVGQGSKGVVKAESAEDVNFYNKKDLSLMLLEYLPGKEFTIDCLTNKEGKLLFCEGRVRQRITDGISVNSSTVDDPRFKEIAEKINQTLSFRGVWFFQLKENTQSELVLMEIAPRVAGTMGLVRCKGTNLVLLSLFDAMDYNISITENSYEMSIDRALQNRYIHNIEYKQVYIDFDDLVIFEGKVNPTVIAFVYQCLNKGIRVSLITRHADVLDETLAKFRLTGIFDELIHIQDGSDKHGYINPDQAIFIDDSFAERQAVHNELGIPVFDAHMIESLMEKE